MSVKGPHYPQYSDDIIKIYSLMIYSDILFKKKRCRRYIELSVLSKFTVRKNVKKAISIVSR